MIIQTIKKSIIGGIVFSLTVLVFGIGYAAIINIWTNTSELEVTTDSKLSADSWNKLLGNFETLQTQMSNITTNGQYIRIGDLQILSGTTPSIADGGTYNVVFSSPFVSTPNVNISSVYRGAYLCSAGNAGISSVSNAGFTVYAESGANNKCSWIAIGKWK